ncbi:hypothetical protein ACFVVM_01275 [Nocardia sp. NPDC058176]|uniref:hypothetical protein n=1 Tax=Nocardia sp. NPDC058176 TaxID=3346368 RepID=UPI0036D9860E
MDSDPDSVVSFDVDDATKFEWRREVVRKSMVGEKFLFLTGMEHFPWAQCRVVSIGWIDELFDLLADDVVIMSSDLGSLLRVFDLEYATVAFWNAESDLRDT